MEAAEEELERRSKFLNSLIKKKKAVEQKEHHECLNVRVRASDMPLALQNRAFACARDNLDSTPGKKLDSKRIALALKKVKKKKEKIYLAPLSVLVLLIIFYLSGYGLNFYRIAYFIRE